MYIIKINEIISRLWASIETELQNITQLKTVAVEENDWECGATARDLEKNSGAATNTRSQ